MLSVNSVTSRFFKGDIFCLNIWSFWKSFGPTSTLMFVIATYCGPLLSLFFKLFLKALADHLMLCYICSKLVPSDFLQVLPQIKGNGGMFLQTIPPVTTHLLYDSSHPPEFRSLSTWYSGTSSLESIGQSTPS